MNKLCIVLLAVVAAVSAKPTFVAPVAYTAGLPVAPVAPVAYTAPVVTATSSQYIARNYNGVVASPYVSAPYVSAPYTYPYASAYAYPGAYPYAAGYPYASAAYVV